MGDYTTINILNDAYSDIESNKEEVIRNIINAMANTELSMKTFGIGHFCNPMTASKTMSNKVPRLYLTWENSFVEMGKNNDTSMLDTRKSFMQQVKYCIKQEEEQIKKTEGKMKIRHMDLWIKPNEYKQYGKYSVITKDYDRSIYYVYENLKEVFQGDNSQTVEFINKQVPDIKSKKNKKSTI